MKYVRQDTDRHGNLRTYIIGPDGKKVRARVHPGEDGWDDLFQAVRLGLFNPADVQSPTKEMIEAARIRGVENHVPLLLRRCAGRAKEKGREFALTTDAVLGMLRTNRHRCAVTGVNLRPEYEGGTRNPFAPSVDRINCQKGYTPENSRIVCAAFNVAIGDFGEDVFEQIAIGFLERNRRKVSHTLAGWAVPENPPKI